MKYTAPNQQQQHVDMLGTRYFTTRSPEKKNFKTAAGQADLKPGQVAGRSRTCGKMPMPARAAPARTLCGADATLGLATRARFPPAMPCTVRLDDRHLVQRTRRLQLQYQTQARVHVRTEPLGLSGSGAFASPCFEPEPRPFRTPYSSCSIWRREQGSGDEQTTCTLASGLLGQTAKSGVSLPSVFATFPMIADATEGGDTDAGAADAVDSTGSTGAADTSNCATDTCGANWRASPEQPRLVQPPMVGRPVPETRAVQALLPREESALDRPVCLRNMFGAVLKADPFWAEQGVPNGPCVSREDVCKSGSAPCDVTPRNLFADHDKDCSEVTSYYSSSSTAETSLCPTDEENVDAFLNLSHELASNVQDVERFSIEQTARTAILHCNLESLRASLADLQLATDLTFPETKTVETTNPAWKDDNPKEAPSVDSSDSSYVDTQSAIKRPMVQTWLTDDDATSMDSTDSQESSRSKIACLVRPQTPVGVSTYTKLIADCGNVRVADALSTRPLIVNYITATAATNENVQGSASLENDDTAALCWKAQPDKKCRPSVHAHRLFEAASKGCQKDRRRKHDEVFA
jgi:hypothetical protein